MTPLLSRPAVVPVGFRLGRDGRLAAACALGPYDREPRRYPAGGERALADDLATMFPGGWPESPLDRSPPAACLVGFHTGRLAAAVGRWSAESGPHAVAAAAPGRAVCLFDLLIRSGVVDKRLPCGSLFRRPRSAVAAFASRRHPQLAASVAGWRPGIDPLLDCLVAAAAAAAMGL